MPSSIWTWPCPGYGEDYITSTFGYRILNGTSNNHKGLDIGAPLGSEIVAASSGEVISSGPARGYGNWIRIDHGNGTISIYGHMKTLYAKVGQRVEAGQVIALVGNEGHSTGPHLHIQIEVNGTPIDPLTYISPSSSTAVSSSYDPNSVYSDESLSPSYYGSVEAGGTTVGQRVSGVTTQPMHAFINIYIGDRLLATNPARPNIIQSFEYTRLDGAGETAMFTVFDDNWEEIEAALAANFDNIYIEYGYYGTGLKSKLHKHLLLNYNIRFESTGTLLSVESVTEGAYDNLTQRSMVLNTFNPTEAVKTICRNLGYTVLDENFDSSADIHADNPFNLVEEFPIAYIQNTIIPQASQENEELFSFEIDSEGVAYFRRESYDSTRTDTLRTYIFQKGYDSSVIDFDVDIKGVFGGTGDFSVATQYRSTVFDTKDKHQEAHSIDKASVVTIATGDTTHTRSNQSNPLVESAGYTPAQVKNRLYYHMKSMVHDAYPATLTIVGDPSIDMTTDRYIRVINVTDKGHLHHTSGVYWIEGITDSIQGGEMMTTLKLVKNATAGDIEGLEIINPKLLIK